MVNSADSSKAKPYTSCVSSTRWIRSSCLIMRLNVRCLASVDATHHLSVALVQRYVPAVVPPLRMVIISVLPVVRHCDQYRDVMLLTCYGYGQKVCQCPPMLCSACTKWGLFGLGLLCSVLVIGLFPRTGWPEGHGRIRGI